MRQLRVSETVGARRRLPQCGSPRLVLPWLNRLAVGSLAFLFAVPPVGVLGALVVKGPQGVGAIFEPSVVVGIALSLFASVSSAFVLWQGRLLRIPWFPPSKSLSGELETILYSKAYALATILTCFVALAAITTVFFSID